MEAPAANLRCPRRVVDHRADCIRHQCAAPRTTAGASAASSEAELQGAAGLLLHAQIEAEPASLAPKAASAPVGHSLELWRRSTRRLLRRLRRGELYLATAPYPRYRSTVYGLAACHYAGRKADRIHPG